jgi:26S proteasome regulatory subunit N7
LTCTDEVVPASEKKEIQGELLQKIEDDSRSQLYEDVCQQFGWAKDAKLVKKMKQQNEDDLKAVDAEIAEAKENLGDSEVRQAQLKRARLFAKIGDKEKSIEAFNTTLENTVGKTPQIDLMFELIRIALYHSDTPMTRTYIDKAKALIEAGGDWERRNLLKIYEGVYLVSVREFKQAATLFLESVATFTCYELCSYNTFIFYAVISSMVALGRQTLRDKVVKAPEILSVQHEIPHLEDLVNSLYTCNYEAFFNALVAISPQVQRDRYFAAHFGWLVREMRVVAYMQFLRSYRSVTLESMAKAFGVSSAFLDAELSRFIATGRLNCKIDKVNGIVETNRPDNRNAKYQATMKNGDLLLSRVQKLSKVISY